MKLSVSAFRAQATAQRKILKPYQNQLNYGTCSSVHAAGFKVEEVPQIMVDKTGVGSSRGPKPGERSRSPDNSGMSSQDEEERMPEERESDAGDAARGADEGSSPSDRSPRGPRTKSNQRWMKLRTTVQLSGAISSSIQKSKPPLKREDSFLKRFSTRQVPETQETVDETGDETEAAGGPQSQDEVNRRRRKRRKELSRTVVNPDENFHFYWLMTVTVCVLYNLWTLIVRQSFPDLQQGSKYFWYACDGFTDVVFVCDILVQFRTGYLEQGLMVYNSRKLAGHYLKSRAFAFDLLALLPLDLLQMKMGANPILRFPRFLKIYRAYSYYYIVESRTVYPNLWRVVNLVHILLILAHWFGCFYYLLSEAEGFQGAWVYPYRQGDDATLARKYLGSLYWSTLTLTTIGDLPTPETNAELQGRSKAMTSPADSSHPLRRKGNQSRLLQFNSSSGYVFTIVSYLIGVFIFATIVGQVGNVITNRNANRLEFERLLDGAKTYMRHHKVPGGMKRRVLRWYDYSWSRGRIQGGGDINTALGLLPDKLKTELALHVNLSVLKKVTIFQECQPEFLHDLVLKMKAYIFTPGDLICRKGEIAREMFIIADGILDVISETGRVLTTMKAGDFFGEIGILNLDGLNKRTADVRSVGYSELFSLSREDVLTAMKDYPEAQEILQSLGRKRLMEAKNASKTHKSQGKQARESDSPGDNGDNAGKRIVEKLRSDVKGLKNALRRSRRGTGDDADFPGEYATSDRKHSILRRMSHVQSSDECDAGEAPIGAGLPLLQRLKLLKEKQDRAKEEAAARVFGKEPEAVAAVAAAAAATMPSAVQRLVSLTEKDDSEEDSREGECSPKASSAARTVAGEAAEGSERTAKPEPISVQEEEEEETAAAAADDDQSATSAHAQDPEMPKQTVLHNREVSNSETSNHVPESNVPNEALEVPKSKDRWNRLKKSSRTENGAEEGAGARAEEARRPTPGPHGYRMKKYNSIDDLSPEYSGLPFVKKLKILNERQRLAELTEKEFVVRSASLDVPERPVQEDANLVRSRSIDVHGERRQRDDAFDTSKTEDRSESNGSPESNETFERRHLKSILKKLSADDGASDEDPHAKRVHRSWSLRRAGHSDLKKLMRAPTVEGYVARHTKLTKSVTFDRETLQSPTDAITIETNLEETVAKGISPTSPTAILTLQLSNLSMIPLARKSEEEEEEEEGTASNDEVVRDVKEAVQQHLDAINGKIESQLREFETELRKRDETIRELRMKIEELQATTRMTPDAPEVDRPEAETTDAEGSAVALPETRNPVKTEAIRQAAEEGRRKAAEDERLATADENLRNPFRDHPERREVAVAEETGGKLVLDKGVQALAPCPAAEDVELSEFPGPHRGGDKIGEQQRQKSDGRARGGLMNRVADLRRTLSRSNDFVTLEIDDSSNSSDADDSHNKDWEIEMLAEELSRREWPSDEMKRLEQEVNTLKEVVCESDLNCFTPSELDLLETILEAKDQRISEIASSSCFDIVGDREFAPGSYGYGRKPSLRCRIGQALSFDFHDMDNRKRRSVPPGKNNISRLYGERQSLDNLLHASGLLRNRVLDDRGRPPKGCRSSLPLVASHSLALSNKSSKIRTSLPSLPRNRGTALNEYLTSSVSSCEDACERKESCESSDENQLEADNLVQVRQRNRAKSSDGINNFVKRVKHAVVGDADTLKDQVPTISRLCDERALRRSGDTVDEEPREEDERQDEAEEEEDEQDEEEEEEDDDDGDGGRGRLDCVPGCST